MKVRYKKGITRYWFYYSIGNLDYAVVYSSKAEFIKSKGWKNIEFEKIAQ